MSSENNYFVLYANCVPVKGKKRSVICDLHKNKLKIIPNDLYEILVNVEKRTLKEIKTNFNNQYDNIIDEYFQFLIENDLGFYTKTPNNFPKLETSWSTPLKITNSIIDLDLDSDYEIIDVLRQLNLLGCRHIQIRCFCYLPYEKIIEINKYLEINESSIVSLDFILHYSKELNNEELNRLFLNYPRTRLITIHSSPFSKEVKSFGDLNSLYYTEETLNSHFSCGIINSDYFSVNIKNFTESINHNSCLNKKISIDVKGNIKNCPSMSHSYGNISKTTLEEALLIEEFKEHWDISKDKIKICQDCEFRRVCTDCRAYLENPKDNHSKPLKCGYNPYTNEWEEWSTNPLKRKAIEYYGMQELVRKND